MLNGLVSAVIVPHKRISSSGKRHIIFRSDEIEGDKRDVRKLFQETCLGKVKMICIEVFRITILLLYGRRKAIWTHRFGEKQSLADKIEKPLAHLSLLCYNIFRTIKHKPQHIV